MRSPELGIPYNGGVVLLGVKELEGPLPAGVLVRRVSHSQWFVRKPRRAGAPASPGYIYGFPATTPPATPPQDTPSPDTTDRVMTQARYLDLSEGAIRHRLGRLSKEVLVDLMWRVVKAQYPLNGAGEIDIHAPFDFETHERVRQVVADTEAVWFHR